jgi:hypothetical protein
MTFDVNITAIFRLCQAAIEQALVEQKSSEQFYNAAV